MTVFASFEQAYPSIMQEVIERGKKVTPRAGSSIGETLEITPYEFAIPADRPVCRLRARKMSPLFLMIEPFYLFTTQDETQIAEALMSYAPNLKKLALNEETGRFDGNYGDRIHLSGISKDLRSDEPLGDQMLRVYRLLAKDPSSRRAVVTVHNPVWDHVDGDSKDIPCTLSLQFMIRNGCLTCFCTMRSNDVWYGTPHNVMMFTFLQRALASWLDVPAGLYFHRANSFHLYTAMLEKAAEFIAQDKKWTAGELSREEALYDIPEIITYPEGHRSIVDTQTDANAVIRREKLHRERAEMPMPYPINGEYAECLFDLLAEFWAAKHKNKPRDILGKIRHNEVRHPSTHDHTHHPLK